MSIPISIYCNNFDCSETIDVSGKIVYRADDLPVASYDVSMVVYVPVADLKAAFKYLSLGDNVTEETAVAQYLNKSDRASQVSIIPDSNSVYTNYAQQNTANPGELDFLKNLALKVFGAASGIDLFSNESNVATSYKNAVLSCGNIVNGFPSAFAKISNDLSNNIGGVGNITVNSASSFDGTSYTTDASANGARAALDILSGMLGTDPTRFTNPSSSLADFPFVTGDEIKMIFTINSHPSQKDINGNSVSVEGADGTAGRKALVCVRASDVTALGSRDVPIITLTGNSSVTHEKGDTYTDQGATAVDFTGLDLTSSITTTTNVNQNVVGSYTVSYNVKDDFNISAVEKVRTVVVVDVTPPSIDAIATSAFSWEDKLNATESNSSGTVSVTTERVEDGQILRLTLNGSNYTNTISSNSTTITIPASALQALTDGQSYTVTANVSDAAGNAAIQITSSQFTVDRTSPSISSIGTSAFSWGALLNPTEDDNNGTVTVTTSGIEDAQTLTLGLNGKSYTNTITSNSTTVAISALDLQALVDGQSYNVTANVSDAAGNAATQVTSSSFAVDRTSPSINAIGTNAISWGALLNPTEDDTDGTVTVTTIGIEDGQTMTLTLDSKNYTNTVTSNSTIVTIPAADLQALTDQQSYTITANVSDAAGNAATQVTSSSFTVDRTPPSINAIGTTAFSWGALLNPVEDDINGTVSVTTVGIEDGQTLTLALNGKSYTNTVTSNSTIVTIPAADLQALVDGQAYSVVANIVDAAGNAATQVTSASFIVDRTPSSINAIGTSGFSWGALLNAAEDDSNGTVTITTVGVEDGQTMALSLNSKNYTSTVNSNTTTVTIPAADLQALVDGQAYSVVANVSDAAGNAATQVTSSPFSVDRTTPSINAIGTTAFSWGSVLNAAEDDVNSTVTVTTSGIEDAQTMTIALNGKSYTNTVTNNSTIIIVPTADLQDLTDGQSYTITANVSDAAGNAATAITSSPFTVDKLCLINAIGTSAFSWGALLNPSEDDSDGTVTVTTSGVEDAQTMTVAMNGKSYTNTVTTSQSIVTVPAADLQALVDGQSYTVTASVSDTNGNSSQITSSSFTVDRTAPAIGAIATSALSWGEKLNPTEDDSDGTVTVTTSGIEDGQTLTLALDGNNYTNTVTSNSTIVTIPASALQALTDGNAYSITANVSDAAGNAATQVTSSIFQVDRTAPSISAIGTSAFSWGSLLNPTESQSDGTVTLTTTGVDVGQILTLTLDGKNYTNTVNGLTTIVTIPAADLQALNDGQSYTIAANVSDSAGNAATQVTSSAFTVDRTPPSINAIGTSAFSWGSLLNPVEDDSDGTVTVTTSGIEDNQTMTIALNGNNYTNTITTSQSIVTIPAAALQALTDGQSYTVTANASDVAGNAATQVTSSQFTVDRTAPAIGAIGTSAFSWGALLNPSEDDSDGTVTVTTTGIEDGQTMTVVLNGKSYTNTVTSNSTVITIPAIDLQTLSDGQSYTATADISDAAGNAATQVTSSQFTVDRTPPSINAIGSSAFSWGSVLNSTEDNADGTITVTTVGVEDAQTLTLALNGTSYTNTITSNSTSITIPAADLQALVDGQSYTVIANVSDAAGNAATQISSSQFTVDKSTPSINAIATSAFSWGSELSATDDDNFGTVTVTTTGIEDGQTMTLALNGTSYTSTVTSSSSSTIIPAADLQALTDGQSYTITANASDAAGNAAAQVTSSQFTVNRA